MSDVRGVVNPPHRKLRQTGGLNMITTPPLTIDELGQLAGLLSRYKTELIHEAEDGARLDEDEHTANLRELGIERVSKCLDEVAEDFYYRLNQ